MSFILGIILNAAITTCTAIISEMVLKRKILSEYCKSKMFSQLAIYGVLNAYLAHNPSITIDIDWFNEVLLVVFAISNIPIMLTAITMWSDKDKQEKEERKKV